jgi:hypothetical protein
MFSNPFLGASVMLGVIGSQGRGGFIHKLEDEFDIQPYAIHCLAHRLQLVVKWSLRSQEWIKRFEAIAQDLYKFYTNQGHKRKAHLRRTAIEMEEELYHLSYIWSDRWIASEYSALSRIRKSFISVYRDLEIISKDLTFDARTRDKAATLAVQISDRNFVNILHYLLDLLSTISTWSKLLQAKEGLLFDKEALRNNMIDTLSRRRNFCESQIFTNICENL